MNVGFAIFFSLIISCFCQKEFKADFELRHPDMPNGFITGVIEYEWKKGDYRLTFSDLDNYEELYKFNKGRGFSDDSDRYEGQFVYRSGGACGVCQTAGLQHAMPILFDKGFGNADPDQDTIMEISFADGLVESCTFEDGRSFTFFNVDDKPKFSANEFAAPSSCSCGKPLDMVFVLDRSGSISVGEFKQEKKFVSQFSQAFEYGPNAAHLGLTHFKKESFDDPRLTLEVGVTANNVRTGVDSMACDCDGQVVDLNKAKDNDRCCCCGTAVSSGMRNGADMLATQSIRPNAGKILMVLTDGRHNRIYAGINDNGKHYGSSSQCPKNDKGNADCKRDLEEGVEYVKSQVPDAQIFAISVGLNEAAEREQLLVIADNNPDRILDAVSFEQLPSIVDQLVALTCDNTAVPCGNCCGFCTCGECVAPSGCDPVNECKEIEIVGSCCAVTTKDPLFCDEGNKCLTYKCLEEENDGQGGCASIVNPVPDDTECTDYECDPATGLTTAEDLCPFIPNCITDDDCDDENFCTDDACILTDLEDPNSAICSYTESEEECNDFDSCTEDLCDPSIGCVFQNRTDLSCDDFNVCTNDFCNSSAIDYNNPCVHVEILCNETDICHNVSCHFSRGCEVVNINCTETDNCTISGCNITTGCYIEEEECGVGFPVGAGIAAGVIAAIVVCAVLAALLFGGGTAYAYTQGQGTAVNTGIQGNPIYAPNGEQGMNATYKAI